MIKLKTKIRRLIFLGLQLLKEEGKFYWIKNVPEEQQLNNTESYKYFHFRQRKREFCNKI